MHRLLSTCLICLTMVGLVAAEAEAEAVAGDATAAAGADAPSAIPATASSFGGHHYLVFDEVEDLSWQSAKLACEALGGHLAVITSKEEAEFINQLANGAYLFLGATDQEEEGTWVWIDGSEWSYTNWYPDQPNDYDDEDYLATYDEGEWVDVDASGDAFWMPTGYICEWDQ